MPKSKDSSVQVAVIVAVLLAVIGGAWLFLKTTGDDPVVTQQSASAPKGISSFPNIEKEVIPVDTALQMAEMAFQSGQVTEPEDGSALFFYRQVMEQDPENVRARTGLDLIATQLTDEANELLGKQDYVQVAERFNLLNRIEPGSDRVLEIQTSLAEKTEILLAQMDKAISSGQFSTAEKLANKLKQLPHADAGRISAAFVSIATGRKELEAKRVEDRSADFNVDEETQSVATTSNGRQSFDDNEAVASTSTSDVSPDSGSPTETESSEVFIEPVPEEETVVTEPVDTISPLIIQAKTRVEQGRLFKPEGDSALHYFSQVLVQDPTNSEAKLGLRGLVQNLTSSAYERAERDNWSGAEELLQQAEQIGLAESLITQTRADIKQQRFEAEKNKMVSIQEFTVEKSVAPKYPKRAIARSVEGWVTVEFIVDESGETQDITVVDSSKQYASQFTKAAISAVQQWRFKPKTFDGQAIASRSSTTVQFKLTD